MHRFGGRILRGLAGPFGPPCPSTDRMLELDHPAPTPFGRPESLQRFPLELSLVFSSLFRRRFIPIGVDHAADEVTMVPGNRKRSTVLAFVGVQIAVDQ